MLIPFPKRTRYADLFAKFETAKETYDRLTHERRKLENEGAALSEYRALDLIIEHCRNVMMDSHRALIALRREMEQMSA